MFKKHPELNYYISDRGIIMKSRGCGEKKLFKTKEGYLTFSLRGKLYLVHRVVYELFVEPIPEGMQINHINGIKTDNYIDNLEVVTPKQNIAHAYQNGLKNPKPAEDNGQSKLSNKQYYCLIDDILKGMSNSAIAEKYGLHSRYVSLIRGKKRVKTIWDQYESENGIRVVPLSGDKSGFTLSQRLALLDDLEKLSNKEVAEKYSVDPSTISHIRAKRMWKKIWEIKEDKVQRLAGNSVGTSVPKREVSLKGIVI